MQGPPYWGAEATGTELANLCIQRALREAGTPVLGEVLRKNPNQH